MALRQHYWNPRTNEACFVDETQLIYAFNERQDAGTWSDLHVHPDWGELLFVATGSIVLCSETGNFLGQGYRATWVPPGVQHEWYLPEASWNRSLFFHASLFEDSPRFPAVPRFGNVPAAAGASFCGGRPQAGLHDGRRETVRTGAYGSPQGQQGSWRPSAHAFRAPSGGAVRGSLGRTRRADMHG